jgi:hypothetical protein
MYDAQRRLYAQLRADRKVVEQAAARLRHRAIHDAYRGLRLKAIAFGLALVLDELAGNLRDLDEDVRAQTLDTCRALVNGRNRGAGRRSRT